VPPTWSDKALAQLARWGVSVEGAERLQLFEAPSAAAIYPEFRAEPGIVIPYFDAAGALVHFDRGPFCRVRYLNDAPKRSGGFKRHEAGKYGQPRASGCRAYFPPVLDWQPLLADPGEPCLITEGELKAATATLAGFPTIGVGGVYNWGPDGILLPELAAINWRGRDQYTVFDSDRSLNPQILVAEARLVERLSELGARCYVVELPHDGETKTGIDDFLHAQGPDALMALLQRAQKLNDLDRKVISLNKSCAWIEAEGLVYDMERRGFLSKDNFINGSRFSTLTHLSVGAKQRSEPKRVSIAKTWLTHPHAQRFGEILFRPGEGPTVMGEHGRPALNMWTGWDAGSGDVTPFLELSRFLFQNLRGEEQQSLPLKLLAYKAQNPADKVPLALVLIGPQGCGKTLWGEIVRDAFAPYGVDVTPSSLAGEFQGWLERSLFALINEAKGEDVESASEQLKALISDLKRPMNEKYRPVRQINTYTMYCITSNKRAVGAFAPDDRRMIVVDCPKKREAAFYYDYVKPWKVAGGPKALLGYLLGLDLKGWKPPAAAPLSAEKYMAYVESLTPVQHLAEDMRTATEQTVKLWLDSATAWARTAEVSGNATLAAIARKTLDNAGFYDIRPWYTPEELALMFPAIVHSMLGSKYARGTPSGMISRELREAGVPYLECADDPRGFKWRGQLRQYLVVYNFNDWKTPLKQSEFERLMGTFPKYSQLGAK